MASYPGAILTEFTRETEREWGIIGGKEDATELPAEDARGDRCEDRIHIYIKGSMVTSFINKIRVILLVIDHLDATQNVY